MRREREREIQHDVRAELGDRRRYPEIVLYPNVCGVFLDEHSGTKRRVGVANPGGADLIGWWTRPGGIAQFVGVELKTERGRQSPAQRQFEELVTRSGGVYVVLRSVDEARAWAEQMRRETV